MSTFLLTAGNVTLLRVAAIVMILFMVDRGLYPHDKVLESQLWKKVFYAGGNNGGKVKVGEVERGRGAVIKPTEEEEGAAPKGFSQSAGVVAVLFLPATVASTYCLAWSTSYIIFPFAIWSCTA